MFSHFDKGIGPIIINIQGWGGTPIPSFTVRVENGTILVLRLNLCILAFTSGLLNSFHGILNLPIILIKWPYAIFYILVFNYMISWTNTYLFTATNVGGGGGVGPIRAPLVPVLRKMSRKVRTNESATGLLTIDPFHKQKV